MLDEICTIGVLSDTHGLLRPSVVSALRGADLILHAGDVGNADTLAGLRLLAPTYAVRGNVDRAPWALDLPETRVVNAGRLVIFMLHDLSTLDLDPAAAGFDLVVSGHSHKSSWSLVGNVHYLNPGSAGPTRFNLPISVARLNVNGENLSAQIIELDE